MKNKVTSGFDVFVIYLIVMVMLFLECENEVFLLCGGIFCCFCCIFFNWYCLLFIFIMIKIESYFKDFRYKSF